MWKNYKHSILICRIILLLALSLGVHSQAQNSCATALPISAGTYTVPVIDGTNVVSTCSNSALAEWYVYTPAQNYNVTVTSDLPANICRDTHFAVYTGTCSGLSCYTSDDDSGTLACNSGNANSYLSKKTFEVTAGTTYYIVWDNRWEANGFDFQLSEAAIVPTPCSTAVAVSAGITTVNAIDGTNVNTTCSTASLAKWYSYIPSQNYHVTVSSDLPANLCKNTNFSVYTGSCTSALVCVANDDDSGVLACNFGNTNSLLSKKTFDVTAGTRYFIVWDNKNDASGFDFQITEAPIIIPVSYTTQTIPTVTNGYKDCVVDMNGDHKDDIVSATINPSNLRINYQGAAGTFTPADYAVPGPVVNASWSIAAGDLNKDGFNDLLIASGSGLSLWQSSNNGTAYNSYTPGQYIFCQRTNFVDINNDGNLDVFSCHDVDPNVYYLNDGAGNYTYYQSGTTPGAYMLGVTASGGNYASLWTDYDNDGDVDMFISKCSGPPCELHRNDGNGIFTDISAIAQVNVQPITSWSSAIADFDNDGDMDILVGANGSAGNKFYRNNLDTTNNVEEAFTNITVGSGWDTGVSNNRDYIAYDFDNDGFVDVMGGGNKIMFNNHDMTFSPSVYSGLTVGAVGDLNDDGFLDIVNGNTVRYAVPNGNNWIKIGLNGIQSNSNGIGARIEIYGAWGKQIRDIRSGEGFAYMSSLNAYFGIGTATTIDKVVIKWPSGVVDTILNPSKNQMLVVTEGEFPLAVSTVDNADTVFTIYPNPAKQNLNIKWTSSASLKSAQVFDLNGRLILKPQVIKQSINVESLQAGTYILLLKDERDKAYTQKFIKS